MAVATLGGVPFRINPSQVHWTYSVNTAMIQTLGGRVIQLLGVTPGDMVIQGLYGHDREHNKESWALAEDFQRAVAELVDKQSERPTPDQLTGKDKTPMHPTHRFFYDDTHDVDPGMPTHQWDFQVYIKSLTDIDEKGFTISHATGKYSYGYELTLFIVQDVTRQLAKIAQDDFLDRLANGVGWKQSDYNGPMTVEQLQTLLASSSPDGSIHGLVLQQFQKAGAGQMPPAPQASGGTRKQVQEKQGADGGRDEVSGLPEGTEAGPARQVADATNPIPTAVGAIGDFIGWLFDW